MKFGRRRAGIGLCAAMVAAAWAMPNTAPLREERLAVKIPMHDGVLLTGFVYKPAGTLKIPTLLIRTPYGARKDLTPNYRAFLEHGYAIVLQDVRGRYDSEGKFDPVRQESSDGSDTLNWIARQPWSDGQVGMIGGSYLGIAQWKAALTGNSHLKAIFPVVSGSDEYRDRFYSYGGAMRLGHRLMWMAQNLRTPGTREPKFADYIWHLPLRTADRAATGHSVDFFQDTLNHPAYDAYWKDLSTREQLDHLRVPVFAVGGWYDNFVQSDLEAFTILSKKSAGNHILIGPWPHNMSIKFKTVDFGDDSSAPIRRYQLEWFDHWMKPLSQPAQSFAEPPVRIFVMGANKWRDEHEWPIARARSTPLYLASKGNANSIGGGGRLTWDPNRDDRADQYEYDPRLPTPTTGGAICCSPDIWQWGPLDQRPVEERKDVLVYSTAPLRKNIEVTGPIRLVVYASTSAPDTDFTAKLVDVFPDGYAQILTDGILRLRYRSSLEKPVVAKPGEIHQLTIDAGVTSNMFRAGHRIRIEISSSNFPRFDRNPNTGRPVADETELRVATQKIYHGHQYPSYVMLPIIP
jgi:uncharacterized protein